MPLASCLLFPCSLFPVPYSLFPSSPPMNIFRQYVAPALIVVVFLLALLATSARIFLPEGLSSPVSVESPAPSGASSSPTS
jgi:hypothetical protein